MPTTVREALASITKLWEAQIELCDKAKENQFGRTARQLWSFLGKDYRELYLPKDDSREELSELQQFPYYDTHYKPRINKSREFVSVMTPHIYQRMSNRLATPRAAPLPWDVLQQIPQLLESRKVIEQNDTIRAWLMSYVLNYTAREYDFDREVLTAMPEALVKGRGVLWHDMVDSPAGLVPASLAESVDGLFIDADCRQLRDAGFVIRRRDHQAWLVHALFGTPLEKLRSHTKSNSQQATEQASGQTAEQGDVVTYYEVYSRVGIGRVLADWPDELEPLEQAMDSLGQNVWLAILPGLGHPLNLDPVELELAEAGEGLEAMKRKVQWPIKFHGDIGNPWPFSPGDFLPDSDTPWARSPLEAGLPMQIFLDHMYGFLMSRIRTTSRDIIIVSNAIAQQVKDALESGLDQEIVSVDGKPGEEMDKLLSIIQFPQVNRDLWEVAQMVERSFEQVTGLLPLLFGQRKQAFRSATEFQGLESHVMNRPDEMAETARSWLAAAAKKEGQAARMLMGGDTVGRIVGEPLGENASHTLTDFWMSLLHTKDERLAAADLEYSLEAGTSQRKNRQKQLGDVTQLIQVVSGPLAQVGMQTGNWTQYNAMLHMMGEAMETDVDSLLLPEQTIPKPLIDAEAKRIATPEKTGSK